MLYALIVILQVNHPSVKGCATWSDGGKVTPIVCPAYSTDELQSPAKTFRTLAQCEKAQSKLKLTGWNMTMCAQIELP